MSAARAVTIDRRFRGPAASGHGGYSAGIVGVAAGNPAEVRLHRPPPIDRELTLAHDGDAVRLLDGDDLVAEGHPIRSLDVQVPTPPVLPADAAAGAEAASWQFDRHPFPECFGCGPARDEGDGLRIFAGPVLGRPGVFAAPFVPRDTLVEGDGDELAPGLVWAALDCPTGAPVVPTLPEGRFIVLGTMAADVRGLPRVGYRYQVMSWLESQTERVRVGCAALLAERGDVLAVARGTWVVVDPDRFN